jgi:hypothetical protein
MLMFFGVVQTDTGETLNIMHPEGQMGGNPIFTFWTELRSYCDGNETEHSAWFKRAEALLAQELCLFCQPLITSLCDGNWNYTEDDYDLYGMRAGASKMSAEEFLKRVSDTHNAWVDIHSLINCVEQLTSLLKSISENENQWRDSSEILKDFEALHETLLLLAKRKTSQVRIGIV